MRSGAIPGLPSPASDSIGKVQETHDYAEGGQFQADLTAGVAINPDSELIPVARAGGITTIHLPPSTNAVVQAVDAARLADPENPSPIAYRADLMSRFGRAEEAAHDHAELVYRPNDLLHLVGDDERRQVHHRGEVHA